MMWLWLILASLATGYWCTRLPGKSIRTLIWLMPLLNVFLGYLSTADRAPSRSMLTLILLLFLGMKAVSTVYRYQGKGRLSFLQWIAFALGWPGMDPLPFEQLGKGVKVPLNRRLLYTGLSSMVLGILLLYVLALLLRHHVLPTYFLCQLSFIPFICIFHIGIGNIGTTTWAFLGVKVEPVMLAPWQSETLGSFWGKRWNVPFIQMMRITLFIPFARKNKATWALILSFLISGIFHEIALTLPVHGGYGLPFLYFSLQALLVSAEKKYTGHWRPSFKRVWVFACLLLPFPLLLPQPFLHKVILPFLNLWTVST